METNLQSLALLDADTLENELRQRMGRALTPQERYYLIVASACSREGHVLPEGLLKQVQHPS
jgi:hypothetical protein